MNEPLRVYWNTPDLLDALYYPMTIYCQVMAAIDAGQDITHFVLCNRDCDHALSPFPIKALTDYCEIQISDLR